MYLTLILLPFISSITPGFFGRFIGPHGAAILSFFIFYEVVITGRTVYIKLMVSINYGMFNVDWGFQFDSLAAIMCCVVTFVSSLVHLYSTKYMSHDPHLPRFMFYLSLFTFFMIISVTAVNFIQMFVGCVGVGFFSYFLINFWFTRIGDFGLFLIQLGGDILFYTTFILVFWSY